MTSTDKFEMILDFNEHALAFKHYNLNEYNLIYMTTTGKKLSELHYLTFEKN